MALSGQGKSKDATKIFTEVYELRKSTLGEDNKDTLETLAMMGGNKQARKQSS